MKLLYGTSNPSKLSSMKEMLKGMNMEIIGLKDVNIDIDVEENGISPLENAKIKALSYYKLSGIPTFSCDSGLYIEGIEEEKQPGVFVRRIGDKYLNDEEYIEYYSNLVSNFEEPVKAKFKNAICLIIDNENIFEYDEDDISNHFLITSKPSKIRKIGFPMDSISLDIETKKYIVEFGKESNKEITVGIRNFFKKVLDN